MPQHMRVAESYLGMKEVPGATHNPTIVGWLKRFALNLGRWGRSRDETPWCAVFVSHVLEACGFASTRHALARSYATYGRPGDFSYGDIILIKRKKKGADKATGSRAGYHVGFLVRVTRTSYVILGGNQGNRVSVKRFPKSHYEVKAIRKPVPAVQPR